MDKVQTLKGFRDFLPGEARKRSFVINTLKGVFESYGFEPLETPALEYDEILQGKYGDEGDKLMYRFKDNGGRKVALRYDQTVPLARVVAQYGGPAGELPMPFKRYQIQPVWRAENTQKGRYREFVQCDIDTAGTDSPVADAEIVACALTAVTKLGFKTLVMEINDREIFEGVDKKDLISLDKLNKVGEEKVMEELKTRGMSQKEATGFIEKFKNYAPTQKVKEIFSYLNLMGFKENKDFRFNPLIVRGLDYYTGAIFELVDSQNPSLSLAGGGRFDNLVGMFVNFDKGGAKKDIPAVGIAFGFDRLIEAMDKEELFPESVLSPTPKVLVSVFDQETLPYSLAAASRLMEARVNVSVYPEIGAKIDKQLKWADRQKIPYVLITGPQELKDNSFTLKDMKKAEQKTFDSLQKLIDVL